MPERADTENGRRAAPSSVIAIPSALEAPLNCGPSSGGSIPPWFEAFCVQVEKGEPPKQETEAAMPPPFAFHVNARQLVASGPRRRCDPIINVPAISAISASMPAAPIPASPQLNPFEGACSTGCCACTIGARPGW
jgi:hypothetical protein